MYLQPVTSVWVRVIGVAVLLAALALAAVLAGGIFTYATQPEARRQLTSSIVIIGLVLVVLGGFCAQAGYRLAFNRPDRNGTLFSGVGWGALGIGLLSMAGLMAFAILSARRPDGDDLLMIVAFAAFGVWCLVLAWRLRPGAALRRDLTAAGHDRDPARDSPRT